MDQAFQSVKKLVEDFRANERNYLSPTYQESHVRQIDQAVYELGVYPASGGRLTEEEIKVVENV